MIHLCTRLKCMQSIKTYINIFLLLIISISCKRNNEIDELVKAENTPYPVHCSNNLKDYDETGIDCGGSCKSCNTGAPATPSCTVNENTLVINNTSYSTNIASVDTVSSYTISGVYNNSVYYSITLNTTPNHSKSYSIVGTLPLTSDQASVQIGYNMNSLQLTSGKVYFNTSGTYFKAVICNGSGTQSNLSVSVKGNINFKL